MDINVYPNANEKVEEDEEFESPSKRADGDAQQEDEAEEETRRFIIDYGEEMERLFIKVHRGKGKHITYKDLKQILKVSMNNQLRNEMRIDNLKEIFIRHV